MKAIRIGLIDFGQRSSHLNSMLKLQDMIDYAVTGEEMGFDKFWLGEHHMPKPALTYNNPTNLVPILATYTKKMSIGTAGTLICIHNPYHVASSYKLYNSIFPNRIELGFANGMPYQAVAMHSTGKPNEEAYKEFEQKVNETVTLLRKEEELFHNEGVVLPPYKGFLPELWTLGSSANSFKRALALGTNLCIWASREFKSEQKDQLDAFQQQFFELHGRSPQIRSVVIGICHPSARTAAKIAREQQDEDKMPHGDVHSFHDFIQEYRRFFNLHDFMFFNGILDPKYRMQGAEKLKQMLANN
ncbi:LLM class flavin-dependent oxidoreductase [Dyadobacter crusticola]|uniref:LLM class flavin-dependent oxidoreductase n=1 Tax=Dyadobacter crusticola TaxID=292407 RepID=UPI0004E18E16|nr:LLM class flavin-dependent oxidoreductase [Dyadobacter crusticola]